MFFFGTILRPRFGQLFAEPSLEASALARVDTELLQCSIGQMAISRSASLARFGTFRDRYQKAGVFDIQAFCKELADL